MLDIKIDKVDDKVENLRVEIREGFRQIFKEIDDIKIQLNRI